MKRIKILFALLVMYPCLCCSCHTDDEGREVINNNITEPTTFPTFVTPLSRYATVEGSLYTTTEQGVMSLNRHSQKFLTANTASLSPKTANTPSGININITTDSPTLKFFFEAQEGTQLYTPQYYSIYKNGEFYELRMMSSFGEFVIEGENEKTHWQVYMPILTGTLFSGIEVEKGSKLWETPKDDRAIYIAIGDSITHGCGPQKTHSSDKTYPAILARGLDLQLYNVAISGSRITPEIAAEYYNIDADIITVLWGYNDWNQDTYTIDELGGRYYDLLMNLCKEQPDATIYAILPTCTTRTSPIYRKDKSVGIDQLRVAERKSIEDIIAAGYDNVKLIDGNALTTPDDLIDAVHLTHAGAERFAEKLMNEIEVGD